MKNYFDHFPDIYLSNSKRILNTPSALAKEGFFHVQETGYLKLKESPKSKIKQFDSYLIAYVLSGKGILEYKGISYPLKQDCIFFIDCNQSYLLQSDSNEPWELLWVHFKGATSQTYYKYYEGNFSHVLRTNNHQEILEKLHTLFSLNDNKDIYTEISSSKLILDIISLLLLAKPQQKQGVNLDLTTKLDDIKRYLDEHFIEKISLAELEGLFYINKYHLCHEFKRCYGITINNYIMKKKLDMVKRLLRFSELSISEIAKECGFYDSSYMNKRFKDGEGISAKEYRHRWG